MEKAQNTDKLNHDRFTYQSSEGLQLLPEQNAVALHTAPIVSENVREIVRKHIDFQLTDLHWFVIDNEMAKFWNNRVPGTWISNEDLAGVIFRHCEKEKMLISRERILQITNQIWEFLIEKRRLV